MGLSVDGAIAFPQSALIVLRVVIRSADPATFIEKYSRFIKDDRIFIFTKASQPPGTRVRFTLELADGRALLSGEGTVTRTRPDLGDPAKPPGMELKFAPLDDASRDAVVKMHALRAQHANAPLGDGTPPPTTQLPPPLPLTPLAPKPAIADVPEKLLLAPLPTTTQLPIINDGIDDGATVEKPQSQADSQEVTTAVRDPPASLIALSATELPLPLGPPTAKPPTVEVERTDVDPEPGRARQLISGGFNTPTPLPAPLPPPVNLTPPFGTPLPEPPPRDPPSRDPAPRARLDEPTGGFPSVGPAPPFVEAWRAPTAPGAPGAPPDQATVPANPFSEISDGAIEYFIEWSLEQSTQPKRSGNTASFANIPMVAPGPDGERRGARLALGLAIGLVVGLPAGGAAVWFLRPPARAAVETPRFADAPRTREKASPPEAAAEKAAAEKPAATEKPTAEKTSPEKAASEKATAENSATERVAAEKTSPAVAATEKPAAEKVADADEAKAPGDELPAPPSLPHHGRTATLRVRSTPPGCEVTIKGEPRGKTPLDLELPPNHRYDIQVALPNGKKWQKRVNLKPPLTDVLAHLN